MSHITPIILKKRNEGRSSTCRPPSVEPTHGTQKLTRSYMDWIAIKNQFLYFLKTQFDPLGCYQDQEDETLNEEDTNTFLSSMQEQQNNIKQMVKSEHLF